ncbi:MAG: response regulator [Chloroflexales bacterium]|nr:response regulator [Chloroflexales bacterium]
MNYILVVDDDAAIREALTSVLEEEGYQVQSAANGREALEILRAGGDLPSLILLDLMMPVMSGWDFRAAQQADPSLAHIPVIVLSADRSVQVKAVAVQAEGYLPKPVDIMVLLETVGRHSPL